MTGGSMAAPRLGLAVSTYQRLLARWWPGGEPRPGVLPRLFARAISAWVRRLAQRQDVRFPHRAIGGWYWIDRFRFELLAGWFEAESVLWCRHLLAPGMVAVDVGAHSGYYARLFSRLVGPHGRVLAFEAEADNFAVTRHNTAALRVEAFHCALGDHEGELPLYVSPGNSNHSLVAGYTDATETRTVAVRTLDAVAREHGVERVDLVKIDVEGAELRVLAGMRDLLARSPDAALLVEVSSRVQELAGASVAQLVATLCDLGFAVHPILADGTLGSIEQTDPHHEGIYVNVLCTRGESRRRVERLLG